MGNNVNINIKIADLQGEYAKLGKAADSSGNGAIDSAYEHSLFTQYCNAAGLDAEEYDAAYTAKDTKNSQKALVKDQGYKGGTNNNMAELDEIESGVQAAVKFAFKELTQPEDRAKLVELLGKKPKMKASSDMATYARKVGEWMTEIQNATNLDLQAYIKKHGDEIKEDITKLDEKLSERLGTIEGKIDQDLELDAQDLAIDLEDLGIDKQDLAIDKEDLKIDKQNNALAQKILKSEMEQNKKLATLQAMAFYDILLDADTNRTAHRTEKKVEQAQKQLVRLAKLVDPTGARGAIVDTIDSVKSWWGRFLATFN